MSGRERWKYVIGNGAGKIKSGDWREVENTIESVKETERVKMTKSKKRKTGDKHGKSVT